MKATELLLNPRHYGSIEPRTQYNSQLKTAWMKSDMFSPRLLFKDHFNN